ncbi:TonB-dependent receptor [soil metagenome]
MANHKCQSIMRIPAAVGAALASLGSCPLLYAQDKAAAPTQRATGDTGDNTVPRDSLASAADIVVTAQRRSQSLIDVPAAVQAFTGDALVRQGVSDLKESINLIPSASKPAEMSQGTETFQIRSVSSGQVIGDPTVGFYLDDFAYSLAGFPYAPSTNVYDIQRLEVIRGPGGTLYGQGSFGGTIRLLTNEPDLTEFGGSYLLSGSLTNGGAPNASANFMVNIPVLTDTLAIRGVMSFDHRGGFVEFPTLGIRNGNDSDNLSGRLKLLYQASHRLKILISYNRQRIEQGFTNRIDNIDPPTANDTGIGYTPHRYSLLTGQIDYDLGFANLTSITGHLKIKTGLRAVGSSGGIDYDITTTNKGKTTSQEARLTSEDSPFNWVIGGYYRTSSTISDQNFTVNDPGYSALQHDIVSAKSYALYGEASVDLFNNKLTPTVGLRQYWQKSGYDEKSTLVLFNPPNSTITASNITGRGKAFIPKFNLAWHIPNSGMLYGEVAKGFRSGAIQSASAVTTIALVGVNTSQILDPDSLWNYEMGVKFRALNNKLQVELAFYQYNWKDAQIQFSPTGLAAIAQAGDVRGRGVDLTLHYRTPISGLQLQFAGNINQAKLRNVPTAITAALPALTNGHRLPGSPKSTATIMADFSRPLANSEYSILINGRYSYRGRQQDVISGFYSGDLNLLSARFGLGIRGVEAYLFADNILNEKGPSEIAAQRFVRPYPRTLGVSLSGKF